jgi:hypothetical protein
MPMRYKTRWHPCFLPTDFRERARQYQAEIERDADDLEVVRETTADAEADRPADRLREMSAGQ